MPLLAVLLVSLAASSATPGSMPLAEQEAVLAALERDRAQLAHWTWSLTTEIRLEGQLEHVDLEQARLDGDGRLERTPALQAGRGHSRRERLSKKLAATVDALRQLADSYACPMPQELRGALARAHAWPTADGRLLRIQSRDVLRRSDSMDLIVDRSTKSLLECSILSSLEGEPIRVEVRYAPFEDGLFLPVVVDVRTELGERELILHTEASAPVRR